MSNYLKAAIGTLFLALTFGGMEELMIWSVLTAFHASELVILVGEAIGAAALLVAAVPLFRLMLKNERERALAPVTEDPVVEKKRPPEKGDPKPTAFV